MTDRKKYFAQALISLGFVGSALLFLPRLGIEADEAMLANGIYDHGSPWYAWKFGNNEIPVMLLSYLGALKTWLYNPYFLIWRPGPVSLRFPMVLLGAATLWFFFELLDQVAGRRAAWIGILLLATDSSFLLIEATDFGFVALQFFLKLSGILLILNSTTNSEPRILASGLLAAGFFLFGLALWDKAVFIWVLFGLAVATMAVFPREVRRYLTPRNVGIAGAAILAGAMPLVIYNIARPLETIRSNANIERTPVLDKTEWLRRTIDGNILFGFITAPEPGPQPGAPHHWYQAASLRLAEFSRHPSHNLTGVALLLSIAALPFLWNSPVRKPMLFGLITCAATWLPMALTAGAGKAVQHVILLWPFQFLVIAAALSRAPLPVAAVLGAILCLSNVAVTNQYYADLIRNGPAIHWTDAIDALNRYVLDSKAAGIFIADWGFEETLNLINEGNAPIFLAPTDDRAAADRVITGSKIVFVSHTPEFTFHPQERATLEDWARQDGYEEEHLATILDRNGRPTFDVFRFHKVHL